MIQSARRDISFALAILLSLAAYYRPFTELINVSLHDGLYSHVFLMPVLAGCFLYWKRDSIFSHIERSSGKGAVCMGIGILFSVLGFAHVFNLSRNDRLSLLIFSALLVWMGAFIWCYGFGAFRRAVFPFGLLLFMVPVPSPLTHSTVAVLQRVSVETVYRALQVLWLPVMRDGYVFHFPQMSIRIAEECAGFHSLIALIITGMIGARLFLRKGWTRGLAMIAIVPITIVKNTLRIIVISLIVVYLGENTFVSAFHRLVGFSFFALLLLCPVLVSLRRLEAKTPAS